MVKHLYLLFGNEERKKLLDDILLFYSEQTEEKKIIEIGEKIVVLLYTGKQFKLDEKLNDLRYRLFKKSIRKKTFTISKLPPTEAAASQHSLRVHTQILKWFQKTIDINKSGWEIKDGVWFPTKLPKNHKLIPDEILKDIRCTCTKGCKKNCGCVANGLKCSEFCTHCFGKNCSNSFQDVAFDEPNESEIVDVLDDIFDPEESFVGNDNEDDPMSNNSDSDSDNENASNSIIDPMDYDSSESETEVTHQQKKKKSKLKF